MMKTVITSVCLLPSVVCVGAATYLLMENREQGWGWLLLIAFIALLVGAETSIRLNGGTIGGTIEETDDEDE